MLYCSIEDDGVGRQQSATGALHHNQKHSLGMKITRARIDMLNKLKGSNATVHFIDKPQGLIAELNLPAETKF